MAEAVASLKSELKHLQDSFPKNDPTFAVRGYTLDEVCCHFFSEPNKKHVINCTISVSDVILSWYKQMAILL